MKIRITLKDPDGVSDSINNCIIDSLKGLDIEEDERDLLIDERTDKVMDALSKWIEYGEYLSVIIDTEAGTAEVVPVK